MTGPITRPLTGHNSISSSSSTATLASDGAIRPRAASTMAPIAISPSTPARRMSPLTPRNAIRARSALKACRWESAACS